MYVEGGFLSHSSHPPVYKEVLGQVSKGRAATDLETIHGEVPHPQQELSPLEISLPPSPAAFPDFVLPQPSHNPWPIPHLGELAGCLDCSEATDSQAAP